MWVDTLFGLISPEVGHSCEVPIHAGYNLTYNLNSHLKSLMSGVQTIVTNGLKVFLTTLIFHSDEYKTIERKNNNKTNLIPLNFVEFVNFTI